MSSRIKDVVAGTYPDLQEMVSAVRWCTCNDCGQRISKGEKAYRSEAKAVHFCVACGTKHLESLKEQPSEIPQMLSEEIETTEPEYRPPGCYCDAVGHRCGVCSRLEKNI